MTQIGLKWAKQVGVLLLILLVTQIAKADDAGQFTVIALPDTQYYAESFPEQYQAQTEWIADNFQKENIKYVLHLGDIVQHCYQESQWKVADKAHKVLDDANVPYGVLPGNHDLWIHLNAEKKQVHTKAKDQNFYNKYFPISRFEKQPSYGGHFGDTNQNNIGLFESAGMKFMVLNLECNPSDEVLAWADQMAKKNCDRRIILATHDYLGRENRRKTGDVIWEKVIRKNPNIFLVLCGHVGAVNQIEQTNDSGGKVYEVLTDFQGLPNGGDGWLTLMRFCPKENLIKIRIYSPTLKKFDEDPKHQIDLKYPMTCAKKKAA
jgi:Calcineurin-like phosphoesterase